MKKWSALHIIAHVLSWIPFILLVIAYFTGNLGVNPVQLLQQRSGDTAIVLLLVSLACTPLNTLFGIPELLKLRRPLGLYAFFYASLHLLNYAGLDYAFNFGQAAGTFFEKRYLLAGLGALLLLIPLAITSHGWWKKQLGKGWKNLHKLVYLAAMLAVLHLAWAIKGDVTRLAGDIWKPVLGGITLNLLLIARIKPVRQFLARQRFKIRAQRVTPKISTPIQKKPV